MGIVIDFSKARPSISVLKAAGVTTVIRYIGWDGVSGYPNTGKNLTKAEAHLYLSSDISIGIVFEYLKNAAALGADQGAKDASLAKEQLAQLEAPVTTGVYFAVDYDVPDYAPSLANTPVNARAKLGPIGDYFAAINRFKGGYRVGGYGGYWLVKRLFDAGLITLGWQTVAWSGGNVDPRISLLQTVDKPPIVGTDVNIHEQKQADFGQWPQPNTDSGPTPAPTGLKRAVVTADVRMSWNTVPGQTSYHFQHEHYKDGFGWILDENVLVDKAVTLHALTAGKHRWRVAADSAEHRWSDWQEFFV